MVTLPITEAKGYTLNYQIGVADIEEITGNPFDMAAFRNVDQYIYMGAEDENDTLPAGDAWSDEQREIAREVYGEGMQEDRFPYCESVYEDVGAAAEFESYDGVGHTVTETMVRHVTEFHREHAEIPDDSAEPETPDLLDVLEAFGIPVEAAVAGSAAILAGLSYVLRRVEN
ncbi:hypothetical protein VB773_07045 [Haloarculaceae archaeon H-GB2-1]|nr:hypothetical protein [Haloarculaceae archaeon H-GB2-1]